MARYYVVSLAALVWGGSLVRDDDDEIASHMRVQIYIGRSFIWESQTAA